MNSDSGSGRFVRVQPWTDLDLTVYRLQVLQEFLANFISQDYIETALEDLLMTTNLIGSRIKALREERRLSQDELARIFGFKDRQTVSAIETGERRAVGRGASDRRREARRVARLFHRSVPSRR